MSPEELKTKIDTIHNKLNEYYELDDSWRTIGKWPDDERGSILYPPASEKEIIEAEERSGHKFPASYKEFLRLHSAWQHSWRNDTWVGTAPPATQKAQDKIAEYVKWQIDFLHEHHGAKGWSPTEWEAKDESNLYLAHHLVVATDFRGAAWVFDTRTRDVNQEMKLVFWEISYGAQDPIFANFYEYLDWAIGEVEFRLEDWKRSAKPAKKDKNKASGSKTKAKGSTKRSPRK